MEFSVKIDTFGKLIFKLSRATSRTKSKIASNCYQTHIRQQRDRLKTYDTHRMRAAQQFGTSFNLVERAEARRARQEIVVEILKIDVYRLETIV